MSLIKYENMKITMKIPIEFFKEIKQEILKLYGPTKEPK